MSPGTEHAGCCSDIDCVLSSRLDPDQIRRCVLVCLLLSLKAAAPSHQGCTELFLSTSTHKFSPGALKAWLTVCQKHDFRHFVHGMLLLDKDQASYTILMIFSSIFQWPRDPLWFCFCKPRQLPEKEFRYRENVSMHLWLCFGLFYSQLNK